MTYEKRVELNRINNQSNSQFEFRSAKQKEYDELLSKYERLEREHKKFERIFAQETALLTIIYEVMVRALSNVKDKEAYFIDAITPFNIAIKHLHSKQDISEFTEQLELVLRDNVHRLDNFKTRITQLEFENENLAAENARLQQCMIDILSRKDGE